MKRFFLLAVAFASCIFSTIQGFIIVDGAKEPLKIFVAYTHLTRLKIEPKIVSVFNVRPQELVVPASIEHEHIFQMKDEDEPGRGYIGLLLFKVDQEFDKHTQAALSKQNYHHLDYFKLKNDLHLLGEIKLNKTAFGSIDQANDRETKVTITADGGKYVATVVPAKPKVKGKGKILGKKQGEQKKEAAVGVTELETAVWEDYPEEGSPAEGFGRSRTTIAIGNKGEATREHAKRSQTLAEKELERERAAHQRTKTQLLKAQEVVEAIGTVCVKPEGKQEAPKKE